MVVYYDNVRKAAEYLSRLKGTPLFREEMSIIGSLHTGYKVDTSALSHLKVDGHRYKIMFTSYDKTVNLVLADCYKLTVA